MSMMQDPKIQQLLANNPMAQQIQAAAMAHVNEHLGFEYRKQIEMKLGLPLPNEDQNKKVPPQIADQIAMMVAKASQDLTQTNQAEAQQQQAQQKMQDPIIQMQMQELQLKQGELQLKQQKQQIEAATKADQIRVEESRIAAQKEIAAMQVAATAAAARDKLNKQTELEGAKLGADIAKHKAQMSHQRASAVVQRAQNQSKQVPPQPPKKGE
jgi:hypothetical protein